MGRSSRKKINKETSALSDRLDQMDLKRYSYRTLHSKATEYTVLLKSTWNIIQDTSYVRPQNKS